MEYQSSANPNIEIKADKRGNLRASGVDTAKGRAMLLNKENIKPRREGKKKNPEES